jgi:LPXTG-site transpeptidase (sortase) family protein
MLRTIRTRIIAAAVIAALATAGTAVAIAETAAPRPHPVSVRAGDAGKLQNPAEAIGTAAPAGTTAVRVQIPAIGIDSSLIHLHLVAGTNQLQAPPLFNEIGWYSEGTVPGDVGPAVIDGHVDTPTEAGVFVNLIKLEPGDLILVTLSTGRLVTFSVDSKEAVPKTDFPTQSVYGPTPTPQLRVITCNGIFDPTTRRYLDNLVVFASMVS